MGHADEQSELHPDQESVNKSFIDFASVICVARDLFSDSKKIYFEMTGRDNIMMNIATCAITGTTFYHSTYELWPIPILSFLGCIYVMKKDMFT